jgi:hypothetical protein
VYRSCASRKTRLIGIGLERSRPVDREIKLITVYSEDVPVDEVVFTAVGVKNQARKPVRETAITYEVGGGTIEVVGRVKALREQVASLFAEKLLGVDLSGERLPPRRVDLSPLLGPITFAVEPQDEIARVKLTRLVISALDGSLTQWLEAPFADDKTLHEVLDDEYGTENPAQSIVPVDGSDRDPVRARARSEARQEDQCHSVLAG